MSDLARPMPITETSSALDAARLAEIRAAGEPMVIRGAKAEWPVVQAGRKGGAAVVAYLKSMGSARPVSAIAAGPEEGGRFFYNEDMSGMNFVRGQGRLDLFLDDLLRAAEMGDPPALAVQSEVIPEIMPGFTTANGMDILPQVQPRIWIGNAIRVAPHYDVKENIAVCIAGRRRFTLFPPEQIANLYPGPFESTPAGTPVSMVDMAAPDTARFPRFAEAMEHAREATLEPGDAIYIPYCWWHGVESLDPVSVLVNYWWTEGAPAGAGGPYDALLHALMAIRPLPEDQRKVWRDWFDYYVFETSGDPSAHLPPQAKGVIGPPDPQRFAQMRQMLRQVLG
ncbi:cupin-like domain-containing protein [Alteraurantiacibacter aquimixticola]|uniref:Cupin-like domain-containing protein n=1 Tax=Alteraurantiacibacter aquimixticola TaxID=2489173 RepID=A0A4T3F1A4_9SPHN|nr:cupin-like domain-containing protein [Alteraurantiacibacter aquimixticola]TIX50965.1 cupin-like domain-containing protein [Alteraurantiacibacter aquimixticola]